MEKVIYHLWPEVPVNDNSTYSTHFKATMSDYVINFQDEQLNEKKTTGMFYHHQEIKEKIEKKT